MANLGKIDYSEMDKYINSPLPKLGEVNLSPKTDNVQYSETSRPKLAAPIDYSKYEDKPFYNDAQAVAKSIGKGAMVNLPEMAGQAAQALSTEGSAVSNWGKGVVDSAKARAKDWQVDMAGRGTVAKALIEGGEMIAPSLATLPAYLAGPVAGAAATVALYGGSSYQDVYDRSKAAGLSDSDAHKAGLMEGAIEAGGELISNKLSLGLLGAGKKAGMAAVTSGTLDQSVIKPFGKAFAKEAVGEQLTEGLQNYGQSKVEGAYGIGKEKGLGESFSETFGPTLGMSVLLSPFGLASHYVSSKSNQESNERAKAIQNVLDSPESGNKMDRRRVVEMLHSDALKAGVDPKEASAWKAQAIIDIANDQPIYRGEVEAEKDLPDTSDKANKDLLPTGERLQNKDLFKTYSKFDNLYKIHDDPNSEDYQSGYQAIISSLSSIINPEEGKTIDPVKQDEARKVLKLVEDANSVKTRQFNRQLEADKAAEQIDQEEADKEIEKPDSSIEQPNPEDNTQIDPEELKRLVDEDTSFNEPVDTETAPIPQEPTEQADTTELPSDTAAAAPSTDTATNNIAEPNVVADGTSTVPADSSQVQAAQAEPVEQAVQPVVKEEAKAPAEPKAGPVDISKLEEEVDSVENRTAPVSLDGSLTRLKSREEFVREKLYVIDNDISDIKQELDQIGDGHSTSSKLYVKELKQNLLSLNKTKRAYNNLLSSAIGKDNKDSAKASQDAMDKADLAEVSNFIDTKSSANDEVLPGEVIPFKAKDRIVNTTSLNEEISADKVAVEQGSEDPEVIQNSQEPIQSLEPMDSNKIDDVLAELEDLRDQYEIAEVEDRKEIRSSIKELEATLKELGYAERQSKVKFTTSENSESERVKVEEDEFTLEADEDIEGFQADEDGEERFDGRPDWLTDNTKTLVQIRKNQVINKRSFDKFLSNISQSIKDAVVFNFVPDFRDFDLKNAGLSDKAVTAKGVYKVIGGVPHIFMNGASSPEDFAGTFIHEVVGHFGVRRLFERFNKDGTSDLSNYDKFLTTLINNNSFFRGQIVNRFSNWSNYESNFIKRNQRKGESTEEMYMRLQSEHKAKGNQGDVVLKFTVDMPKGKETRYIPVEVAVQLADEHIAELAKEMYFNEKFIEKEVGLGLQGDPIRAAKRTQLRAFLNSVWGKVRHYLRSIFGEYVNTISQKDLDTMVAASFFNIFHNVDKEMLSLGSNKPLSLKREPVAINTSGYKVQLEQSDESTRYDQDAGLEENEITNPFLLADIPELSKFIDLTVSGFGNHNDTIRSDVWKKLQEKINDNPLLASMKALGNMPFQEAYTAIQNVYKGQIAKVESTVKDMASVLEGLNASTNDAVFEYMTNPNQDVTLLNITPSQQEVVKNAKDAINELGRVSMELGLIPEESYNKNKDAYLHTMYLKYLDQYRGSGKSTSLLSWMKAKKKLNARERAALGEIKDVKFLIAETLGVISRDHVLINMFNTVAKSSNRNGLYWTLTNEDKIKLPWDNRKTATIDKAYKLVDDMAFIISESKGENKVTFDGKESTIVNLVKDREEIISRINALENKALEEAHKHALESGFTTHEDQHDFLRNHYVHMPNTARYGLLRNQWVRKEIYNDLDVLTASYDISNKDNIEKFFARGGTLEKVNRLWKMSMVALNPGSWIRNIAGNFTLLDLSTSTSSTKLIGMLHSEIMKTMGDKKPSEFWKLAEEYGLFGTTFSAVELQDMYSKYGDELESARASYESRTASSWEKSIPLFDNRFIAIGKMLAKGKDLGHRTSATTSKAYAFVEGAFKTVSFKDYVLTWESQNQQEFPGGWKSLDETQQRALFAKAAAHANEALFDYSQVPSAIKTLRRIPFGAPFLTFSYKAGPASVRAMINHPVKFAKYATLPALLTMIAMVTNDWDDKDIAHFKARLPEYYRNNPGIAFLPFKDSLGRPQILPLDYLLPWSQWATASRKVYANFVKDGGESPIGTSVQSVGTVLNEFGFLGGPTPTALAAMLSGKDSFTGRSILTAGASADQQLMEAMMFTYNMATPAWLSSHGWFGKMYQAFGKPDTNQFGEVRFTPAQAVSDITGFRPISIMEKGGIESRRKEFEFRLKEVATYKSKIANDPSLNQIAKTSKIKDASIREKMIRTQMREALAP
jgi:hypothetical protein